MTADKISPTVNLVLDKERTLFLDLNGMRAYQKITGNSLLKPDSFDVGNVEHIQAALYACLLRENPDLEGKYEQVGDMVNMQNIIAVIEAIIKAMTLAMPEAKKGADADERPLAGSPPAG